MLSLSTSEFTYCKESKQFVAEISDFGSNEIQHNRIYEDITLVSPKTGVTCRYALDKTVYSDNKLVAWVFTAVDKSGKDTSIELFNN